MEISSTNEIESDSVDQGVTYEIKLLVKTPLGIRPACIVWLTLSVKYTIHLNGFNKLSDPIIWIWITVYTYQINWKNAANFCECASEIFASYLWRRLFLVKLTKLNCFISIFKGFTKSVSYLALRFSKL